MRFPLKRSKTPAPHRRNSSASNAFLKSLTAFLAVLLVPAACKTSAAEPAAAPNQLTPEQVADGWISLFDGETLFGWTPTSNANWHIHNGMLAVFKGDEGFLMTNAEFADYELHVEFMAQASTNSGVFLRTPLKPTDPAKDCYELNVAPPENPFPTASLVARHKFKMPYEVYPPDGKKVDPAAQELLNQALYSFDVTCLGDEVTVRYLGDEELKYNYRDPDGPRRGRIALQFRDGAIAFRNIRLKPLGLKPMLNGEDLTGWNTANVEKSKFEVADNGELHVTNGRGILETDASYGDFVMQLDAYVDGDGLNSGVFFRSISREYANGYESQIHNGFKDNDPTKPTDFGTGAIYRRIAARRVVSKDREWFTKTIIATGPHIAVWVNGYQVTDWIDKRPPNDNPREGLRTKPGTIAIQGHDPTTNLRFRNLKIAELPAVSRDAPAERAIRPEP